MRSESRSHQSFNRSNKSLSRAGKSNTRGKLIFSRAVALLFNWKYFWGWNLVQTTCGRHENETSGEISLEDNICCPHVVCTTALHKAYWLPCYPFLAELIQRREFNCSNAHLLIKSALFICFFWFVKLFIWIELNHFNFNLIPFKSMARIWSIVYVFDIFDEKYHQNF